MSTATISTKKRRQTFIVIGAGPVGLQAALLLSKAGHTVTVYDKLSRDHVVGAVERSLEDTYPIGVNRRGLASLQQSGAAEQVEATGILVRAWQIYAAGGDKMVAEQGSNNVYGQTRAQVTRILLQQALSDENIVIQWQHALKSIDFATKQLTFTNKQGDDVTVDTTTTAASSPTTWCRVLACDGVHSVARKEIERTFGPDGTAHASLRQEYYNGNSSGGGAGPKNYFVSQVTPWAVQFRVLFSSQSSEAKSTTRLSLDPGVHYIFNGIYTAAINPGDNSAVNRWSIVVSIKDTDNDATRALLTSDDASPENVRQLREYVEQKSSQLGPYLSNDDLKAFFHRRIFRGALVRVNQLNVGEFLCLLGDSAHSAEPGVHEDRDAKKEM